jgi:aminopeptidase N
MPQFSTSRTVRACVSVLLLWLAAPVSPAAAQRLPATVIPSHYTVAWTPDLGAARFTGTERIDVTVATPTRTIVLNALELEIRDVRVTQGGTPQPASVAFDPASQQATLTVARELAAGPAQIELTFAGTLNDQLAGLYLSKTAKRRYAVTQFEATDARRAFPCFDEPALKATFDVTAVVDAGDMAISNMPATSDRPGPAGKHTVTFATTRPLPTYLVALLVGDFECVEGREGDVPLRVCATPGHVSQMRFALDATKAVLAYYRRYYTTPYPFPKLDQIAVPDFMAGAMENAGAIVYRETDLLADDRTASPDHLNGIAGVIAHEIAHQWFGDLVTMAWWDDVWLNEGFATWMSSKPLAEWKPEWEQPLQDAQDTQVALGTDAVASTRAIKSAQSRTPAEIQQLFDGISYGKAAAVLRMLEQYLGPDVFQRGVNAYLERHAWKNATADDFWATLAATSGKPVDTIMRSFVTQPGAPLLDVLAVCEAGKERVSITQRRFFSDPGRLAAGSPERWTIPVCLRLADGTVRCELAGPGPHDMRLDSCSPWIMANADGRGYYRTAYAAPLVAALAHAEGALSSAERIAFLLDQWALTSVERQTIPAYLDLVAGLGEHATDRVMQVAWGPIPYVADEIVAEADRPAFRAWVHGLATPYLQKLGFEPRPGDDVGVLRTRARVLARLAHDARDPQVLARLRTEMDKYLADPASVPPSLTDTIVSASARFGDQALYDRMVRTIETTSVPDVRAALEYALVTFEDPAILRQALDRTMTPAVRNQDMVYMLLRAVSSHHDERPMVWRFIKAHLAAIQSRSGSLATTEIVRSAGAMCDPALREDARAFFAAHPLEGSEVTLQQELERADTCIRLVESERPRLSAWLGDRRSPTSR